MNSNKLKLLTIIFLVFASTQANAFLNYDVNVLTKENTAEMNLTVSLQSDQMINLWQVQLALPENSKIISINDSNGKINNFDLNNGIITFKTNSGKARNKELIEVNTITRNIVKENYDKLNAVELSLPGRKEEELIARINAKDLISYSITKDFVVKKDNNYLEFTGKGPLNLRLLIGNGNKYKHYETFFDEDINAADNLFNIIPSITGIMPSFKRFPIIALNANDYNKMVNKFSEGVYKGGLIIVNKKNLSNENMEPLIIHETTHGFNEQVLKWNQTNVQWFDEGLAKYLEFLVREKLNRKQPQLFGEKKEYRKQNQIIIIKPNGEKKELWDYYEKDKNFMLEWNPGKEHRVFGYAFSELVIRNYIKEHGSNALHKIYEKLFEVKEEVKNSKRYNEILKELGLNLKPCYSKNYVEFEKCLKEINEFEYKIPEIKTVKVLWTTEKETNIEEEIKQLKETIEIERKKAEEEKKKQEEKIIEERKKQKEQEELKKIKPKEEIVIVQEKNFFQTIIEFFNDLINSFLTLFKVN